MKSEERTSGPETLAQFEDRKRDHIQLSLQAHNEALGESGLDRVQLIHEALPEIDFENISIEQTALGMALKTPFLVSSMTAGHYGSLQLNQLLARCCEERGWMMGVGSQRRELNDPEAAREWVDLRKQHGSVVLLGNLGLSQLIQTRTSQVKALVDALQASAMIVHLNSLQEALQPEGTPHFRGGLMAIERLVRELEIPVVVKETGCGFSLATLRRLKEVGVAAVDVSGYGGTHWGRIEGDRHVLDSPQRRAARTFAQWGVSTLDSLLFARQVNGSFETWASGGLRSGLDAAKAVALGANVVGVAKPILAAALEGEGSLNLCMETFEYELKTALFCTGSSSLTRLGSTEKWKWRDGHER